MGPSCVSPAAPTARQEFQRQRHTLDDQIEYWESQRDMLAPEDGPNRTLYQTRIDDLVRQRDNPDPKIERS